MDKTGGRTEPERPVGGHGCDPSGHRMMGAGPESGRDQPGWLMLEGEAERHG